MAIPLTPEQALYREERTEEVHILCEMGTTSFDAAKGYIAATGAPNYAVHVIRVTRDYYANQPPVEIKRRTVTRDLTALLADPAAAALLLSLPPVFDRWATETSV